MRFLVAAFTLVLSLNVSAAPMCADLFRGFADVKASEAETAEVLRQMVFTPEEAREEIARWAENLQEPLTIMEHTSVAFLLRSKYIHDIATPDVEQALQEKFVVAFSVS